MKTVIGISALSILSLAVACTTTNTNATPDGGTSSSSSSSSSSGTSGTSGTSGSTGTDGGPTSSSGGPAEPMHAVSGLPSDERVTGIYCPSTTTCVFSASDGASTKPHISTMTATTVNGTALVTSDDNLANTAGVLGTPGFLGFSKVGDTLVAQLDNAGSGFVSAKGDPTAAANWSVVKIGTDTGAAGDFGLNAQYGFAKTSTGWIQIRMSFVFTSTADPGPTTPWAPVWSPQGSSPIPSNLDDLRQADPTLCDSEVGYSNSPHPVQATYVAADGSIALSPAMGLNQQSNDPAGVCISTDGGNRFHLAKLNLADGINGPTAVFCTSKDHCVVAGGQVFVDNSHYLYVSNNASQGATSTWTKATIPAGTSGQTIPSQFFFAPDGKTGWLVGNDNAGPLLWATTDGGATWTDQKTLVSGLTEKKLWSGYAIDATHIVLGGDSGTILSTL